MLIKATEQITHISDDQNINSENYFESLSFIGNLYKFINKIKTVINIKSIEIEPTFKGKYTCEKYGIPSNLEENEMRLFVIKSEEFFEDDKVKKLKDILAEYKIEIKENILECRRNEE